MTNKAIELSAENINQEPRFDPIKASFDDLINHYLTSQDQEKYIDKDIRNLLEDLYKKDQKDIEYVNNNNQSKSTLILNHSLEMAYLILQNSKILNIDTTDFKWLVQGALLHDYGKINVAPEVLNNDQPSLSPEGKQQIDAHNRPNDPKWQKFIKDKIELNIITLYTHATYKNVRHRQNPNINIGRKYFSERIVKSDDYERNYEKLGTKLAIFDIFESLTSEFRSYHEPLDPKKDQEKIRDIINKTINDTKQELPELFDEQTEVEYRQLIDKLLS